MEYYALSIIFTATAIGLLFLTTDLSAYVAYLAGVSVVSLAYMAFDKLQAQQSGSRVPEGVLHLLNIAGGLPAIVAGMLLFHHKTQSLKWYTGFLPAALVCCFLHHRLLQFNGLMAPDANTPYWGNAWLNP